MSTLVILFIAVGLAMDAFAVSVGTGIRLGCVTGRQRFRLAFFFGFFQFLMPVIGWLGGTALEGVIGGFDHWVAFGILGAIGVKMIIDSGRDDPVGEQGDPTRGMVLLGLSLATSIDAFSVGFSMGILHQGIWYASIIIGLVAAGFTLIGIELGCRIGWVFGKYAERFGGIVLIGIGFKILLDHLAII